MGFSCEPSKRIAGFLNHGLQLRIRIAPSIQDEGKRLDSLLTIAETFAGAAALEGDNHSFNRWCLITHKRHAIQQHHRIAIASSRDEQPSSGKLLLVAEGTGVDSDPLKLLERTRGISLRKR